MLADMGLFLPGWFEECSAGKALLEMWASFLRDRHLDDLSATSLAHREIPLIEDVELIALWRLIFGEVPELPRMKELLDCVSITELTTERLEKHACEYCALWLRSRRVTATVERSASAPDCVRLNPWQLVLAPKQVTDSAPVPRLLDGRCLDEQHMVLDSSTLITVTVAGIDFPSHPLGFKGWEDMIDDFSDVVRDLWPAWVRIDVRFSIADGLGASKLSDEQGWTSCPLNKGFKLGLTETDGPAPVGGRSCE